MGTLTYRITALFGRFEDWFNHRFGWFFTNGMKDRRERDGAFKA